MSFHETLQKLNDFSQEAHHFAILSPQVREELSHEYGALKVMNFTDTNLSPPTPGEYIDRAGEYLSREQTKGFISQFKKDDFSREVSRNHYMQRAQAKKAAPSAQKLSSVQEICQDEPFQAFWLNTNVVKTSTHNIRALPFKCAQDSFVSISQFLEAVASYVRILKHDKKIENSSLSKSENNQTMYDFINKVREIEHDVIQNTIDNFMIDNKLIPENIKMYYKIPPEEMTTGADGNDGAIDSTAALMKDKDFEFRLFYQHSKLDAFPECYRLDPQSLSTKIRKKQVESRLRLIGEETAKRMNEQAAVELPPVAQSAPPKSPRQLLGNDINGRQQCIQKGASCQPSARPKLMVIENGETMKKMKALMSKRSAKKKRKNESSNDNDNDNDDDDENGSGKMKVNKIMNYGDVLKMGWKETEMLKRSGRFISDLDQLSQITSDFDFRLSNFQEEDNEVKMPFQLTPVKPTGGPNLIDEIWSTADIASNNSRRGGRNKTNPNDSVMNGSNNDDDLHQKGNFNGNEGSDANVTINENNDENDKVKFKSAAIAHLMNGTDAVRLLNKYSANIIASKKRDDEEERSSGNTPISARLEAIWDRMGFAPRQKLTLLIKYTENTDRSSNLDAALKVWENSLAVAEKYERVYHDLKAFLKIEARTSRHKEVIVDQMLNELKIAEESLLMMASQLYSQYGDEMVYHRMPVAELITKRRRHLKNLCTKEDFTIKGISDYKIDEKMEKALENSEKSRKEDRKLIGEGELDNTINKLINKEEKINKEEEDKENDEDDNKDGQ